MCIASHISCHQTVLFLDGPHYTSRIKQDAFGVPAISFQLSTQIIRNCEQFVHIVNAIVSKNMINMQQPACRQTSLEDSTETVIDEKQQQNNNKYKEEEQERLMKVAVDKAKLWVESAIRTLVQEVSVFGCKQNDPKRIVECQDQPIDGSLRMRNLRGMSKLCFSSCEVNKKATARSIRLPNCHENTSEVALIPSVSFRRPSLLPLLIKPDKQNQSDTETHIAKKKSNKALKMLKDDKTVDQSVRLMKLPKNNPADIYGQQGQILKFKEPQRQKVKSKILPIVNYQIVHHKVAKKPYKLEKIDVKETHIAMTDRIYYEQLSLMQTPSFQECLDMAHNTFLRDNTVLHLQKHSERRISKLVK